MLETPEAVFDALRENNERPFGRPRTVRAEELVEAAEQFDDKGALVTALFELMSAYTYSAEDRKSPVVFARIVRMWDERPEDFSEWEERQLYWRFKWVATALLQVPEMPLAAVEKWLDEMADRYRKAGHGLQPVYAMRHHVAAHTGVGREQAYELWATRGRTDLSDCEACETRNRALYFVAVGDEARAMREWEPVLRGEQTCLEEPYTSMAHALLPLVRAGRLDEARSHHLAGYRYTRGKQDMAASVGRHVEFCALTRNEARGLELLAENRSLFDATGAPLALLSWLTGVQVLLARLAAQGHGDLAVAGPAGRNWTVDDLVAHVSAEGDRLAAAFDARNGTTAVGDNRRQRLARDPLLDEPLALGLRAATRLPQPAPAAPPAAASEPADIPALVRRAREWAELGRPDADPLWDRLAALVDRPDYEHDENLGKSAVLRAEVLERQAFRGLDREEWASARETLLRAAEVYEAAGLPGRACTARARAAAAVVAEGAAPAAADGPVDPFAEIAAEQALAAELSARGAIEPDRYLAVLQCAALAARERLVEGGGDPEPGRKDRFDAAIGHLLAEAERLGSLPRAAQAHQYAADVATRTGDLDRGIAEATTALELLEKAEQPWRTPRPLALLAQFMLFADRPQDAVSRCHQALAAAARWPDDSLSLGPLHAILGHACALLGDNEAAARHLSEAADRLDRDSARGSDEHAAQVRLQLADVLGALGRPADGVAVLESAVLGDDGSNPRLYAQIRLDLARGLAGIGEQRAAADEFVRLADTVAAWTDEQVTHTLVASEAATALAAAGQWDAADRARRRAVESDERAPRPGAVLEMLREFARLGVEQRGPEGVADALDRLDEADALIAAVPADAEDFARWFQTGSVHYRRGRTLAEAERYGEALAELERAIECNEEGGPAGEQPRAEALRVAAHVQGFFLEDVPAAVARLTAGITRCEAAGLPEAARILEALRTRLEEHEAKRRSEE
jgi:tetratricopeptide (TPR) repeat protein